MQRVKMTLQAQHSLGRSVDHGQEKSAMVDEQRAEVEGMQVVLSPMKIDRMSSASTMEEWWCLFRASVGPELSHLHWDILNFCKAYKLTPQQVQLRKDALASVERAVHEVWRTAEVHLFGSTATGLALPWSDIDVAIMAPKHQGSAWRNPTAMSWQNALSAKLNRFGQCRSLQKLPSAKVPILKVVFKSGIACDISFDVRNTHAGVSVIRRFMDRYEACRPLCLVLKFFLGQNNLNELHTGGVGSFCISTMVISHLHKTASIVDADLGILLLSFFAHYSNMHNYSTDVVSTRPGFCGSKQDKGWVNENNPQLLAVEDPLDPTSDIGKGSYRIEQVRNKFSEAQRLLLTHWHDEHALAQIVDITSNLNQRPAPPPREKSKKSKRGGKKKRRIASGQDEYVLSQQPSPKIQCRHHPQQGSGLVTKRQLDCIMGNDGGRAVTSGLPPISKRLRTGRDEVKFHSVQNVVPSIAPAQQGVGVFKRTHGNSRGSHSLEINSSPTLKPRESGSKHQAAAGFSRAQEYSSKGSDSMRATDATSRKNATKIPNHPAAGGDCCPLQSVHSHIRQNGMDAMGHREYQDEKLNIEFWESQLTSRSKPRKTSLMQGENLARCSDFPRTQERTRSSQSSETNSIPMIKPTRTSLQHQKTEEDGPIQSGYSYISQAEEPFGLCGTGGSNELAQAMQIIHPERSQNSGKMQPKIQNETSVEKSGSADIDKDALAVQNLHLERSQNGAKTLSSTQDEALVVDLDFWEGQLTTKRKSQSGSLPIRQRSRGIGKDIQPAMAIHPEQPAQGKDVVGGMQGKEIAGERLEPKLTTERKSRFDCFQPPGPGDKTDQPALRNQHEQPPQGMDVAQEVQEQEVREEGLSLDFWEALLAPRRKFQKDALGNPRIPGGAVEVAPRLKLAKSSSMDDVAGERHEHVLPKRKNHLNKPQHDRGFAGRSRDERLLGDFWEAQLAPRLKAHKFSSKHSAAGCEDEIAKPEQKGHLEQQQPSQSSEVLEISPDERKLVDFWETHLNSKTKSKKGPPNGQQAAGGRDEVLEISPDERKLADFWETYLNPKPKSKKGPLNDRGGADAEDAHHGYDGILVDFWEAHLTPSLKSRKGSLTHEGIAGDEDIQPVQKTHRTYARRCLREEK